MMNGAAPSPNGPGVVAMLRRTQGEVFVFTQSPADRTPVKPGQAILEGQAVLGLADPSWLLALQKGPLRC